MVGSETRPSVGALQGITVLEVASYVTGPYAGMLLADLGAQVIKVEEPPHGDPFRTWDGGDYATTFRSFNRNKKSITLNLKTEQGREILLKLASQADVLIENFRPGVVQKLAIAYDTIRKLNPRIIYCSISGFGQDGPYRDWPGYDTIGQALGGLLGLITDLDAPKVPGVAFSDQITGIAAAYGILGALYARERTGRGQKVETSLLQATVSFVLESATRYLATGVSPRRETRVQAALVFAFVAGDGLPFVVHLSSPSKFWEQLTQALEKPELREDPRFKEREARIRNYALLHQTLAETFGSMSRGECLERLRAWDVPCAPLYTIEEVFQDPQVRHLGMPITLHHPTKGDVRLSGSPVCLSETPVVHTLAPPVLGEQTQEVLRGLGYDGEALATLRRQGII